MCVHAFWDRIIVRNDGLRCSGHSVWDVLCVGNDFRHIFKNIIRDVVVVSRDGIYRGVSAVGGNTGSHVLVYVSGMTITFMHGDMNEVADFRTGSL